MNIFNKLRDGKEVTFRYIIGQKKYETKIRKIQNLRRLEVDNLTVNLGIQDPRHESSRSNPNAGSFHFFHMQLTNIVRASKLPRASPTFANLISTNSRLVARLDKATDSELLQTMRKLHGYKADSVACMDKILTACNSKNVELNAEMLLFVIQFYSMNEHVNSTLSHLLAAEQQFKLSSKSGFKEQEMYCNLIETHLKTLGGTPRLPLKMLEYLKLAVERKIDLPESLLIKCMVTAGSHGNISAVKDLYQICANRMSPALYNEIIHAAGNCGDMYTTQEYFEKYQQSFKKQDAFVYVSFAKACVQNDQVPVALDILMKLMPSAGLKCETRHLNSLLISLIYSKKFEDAEEILEMMNEQVLGCIPNGNTIDLSVILYSAMNKYEKALEYFDKREKDLESSWKLISLGFGHFGLLSLERKNLDLALDVFKLCGSAGNQLPLFAALLKQKSLTVDQIVEISNIALKDNKLY